MKAPVFKKRIIKESSFHEIKTVVLYPTVLLFIKQ